MSRRRDITSHHGQGDLNDKIRIEATGSLLAGGADHEYIISVGLGVRSIVFHGPGADGMLATEPNGVTNEALLAVVKDRLEGFQAGPFACFENQQAIDAIQQAMAVLQQRTRTRQQQGVEGKMAAHIPARPDSAETVGRVTLTAVELVIDMPMPTIFSRHQFAESWGSWNRLEPPLRKLSPPVTNAELDLIGKMVTGSHSRSGYAELRSALRGIVTD